MLYSVFSQETSITPSYLKSCEIQNPGMTFKDPSKSGSTYHCRPTYHLKYSTPRGLFIKGSMSLDYFHIPSIYLEILVISFFLLSCNNFIEI